MYRKKPVVINAWKWDETKSLFEKIGCKMMSCNGYTPEPDLMKNLRIETLEGVMSVNKGDFIIKGIKGEFYPCKPDIFALTYELVGK